MPEPYELAAEGDDEFRVFVLKTDLPDDRWIRAVDFKPGNRKVVHHVIAGRRHLGPGPRARRQGPEAGLLVGRRLRRRRPDPRLPADLDPGQPAPAIARKARATSSRPGPTS